MKNFTEIETVYVKKLKTVQLKLNQDYLYGPSAEEKKSKEALMRCLSYYKQSIVSSMMIKNMLLCWY